MTSRTSFLVFAVILGVLSFLVPLRASAVERNFAGSAQLDYHYASERGTAEGPSFRGFTLEAALKLSVDVSERFSANAKVCVGCHGVETDMLHADYRFADALSVRVGRFSPSFGSFNLRHDPANHRLSDKPLPYDMGRMLRLRDWNLGVLPSPFPDNGVEASGAHWFGRNVQVDYALHVVSGFKGATGGTDLDFVQSRTGSLYYVDNNDRPSFGGRFALTTRFSQFRDATVGASAMYGTFDPQNKLSYAIVGADLSIRLQRTNLRFEYLVRRQDLDVSTPAAFKYDVLPGGDYFLKHGGYAELEVPLTRSLDVMGRFDFLWRSGNVAAESALQARSGVLRYTLGLAYTLERGLRIKYSTELWSFSDLGLAGRHTALSAHLGVAAAF